MAIPAAAPPPKEQVYTDAPAAPANLAASIAGEDSIYLTWTDPFSFLPGTNESGYKVLRSLDGGDFEECANTAKDSEEYTDIAPGNGIFSYQSRLKSVHQQRQMMIMMDIAF